MYGCMYGWMDVYRGWSRSFRCPFKTMQNGIPTLRQTPLAHRSIAEPSPSPNPSPGKREGRLTSKLSHAASLLHQECAKRLKTCLGVQTLIDLFDSRHQIKLESQPKKRGERFGHLSRQGQKVRSHIYFFVVSILCYRVVAAFK